MIILPIYTVYHSTVVDLDFIYLIVLSVPEQKRVESLTLNVCFYI